MDVKPAPPPEVEIDECLKKAPYISDVDARDRIVDAMWQMKSIMKAYELCPNTPLNAKEYLKLRLMIQELRNRVYQAVELDTCEFMEEILDQFYDTFALDHFN